MQRLTNDRRGIQGGASDSRISSTGARRQGQTGLNAGPDVGLHVQLSLTHAEDANGARVADRQS
jgi:hypothetical protein